MTRHGIPMYEQFEGFFSMYYRDTSLMKLLPSPTFIFRVTVLWMIKNIQIQCSSNFWLLEISGFYSLHFVHFVHD